MWYLPILALVGFALLVLGVYVRKYPVLKLVSVIYNLALTITLICMCFHYHTEAQSKKTLINYYKDQCIQQYDRGIQDGISAFKHNQVSTTCTIQDGELIDEYYTINE